MKRVAGGMIAVMAVLIAAGCGSSSNGSSATKASPATAKNKHFYCDSITEFKKAAAAAQYIDPDKMVEKAEAWDFVVASAPEALKADAHKIAKMLHDIADATNAAGSDPNARIDAFSAAAFKANSSEVKNASKRVETATTAQCKFDFEVNHNYRDDPAYDAG